MHEMSIVLSIFSAIDEKVISLRGTLEGAKVAKISLKVGEISTVVPEALQFSFEVARKSTIFDGAVLEVEKVPVRGRCQACSQEFPLDDVIFICPGCGSPRVELTQGRELFIDSFELDDDDSRAPGE